MSMSMQNPRTRPLAQAIGAVMVALAGVPATAGEADEPRFEIELEAGSTWQSRNKVEIPNDGTATRFSLKDLTGSGPWPAGRVTFHWNFNDRHGLRLLAAPLSLTETGSFDQTVLFAGEAYATGVPTEGTYQFNSWRATYRYSFKPGEHWRWWLGFTAKVRDAKIELRQGATTSRDTDVGFVPLAYVRGDYDFAERWRFSLEADALAGGPGRAADVSLKLGYAVDDRWRLDFGYRTVEGGADVDDVYAFAWLHSAVVSGSYRWGGD